MPPPAEKPTLRNRPQRLLIACLCLPFFGISLLAGLNLRAEEPKAGATLEGHTHSVHSVAFGLDGKILASRSDDKTIKLWDVATGKERHSFEADPNIVSSVAFSSDAKTVAEGSHTTIKVWEVATGKLRATLQEHTDLVVALAFSQDSETLASGSADNAIKVWEVATGKLRATLLGHSDSIYTVAFSPDGKILASGSNDKTIKLWEVGDRQNKGYTSRPYPLARVLGL